MSQLMNQFLRYLGVDYSGAMTAESSLKGLRVYEARASGDPVEVPPPPSPRRYWTRRGLAAWLVEVLRAGDPVLVGIDHAFSFPMRYFEAHRLPPHWPSFLDDFQRHWPTDSELMYVDFIRDGLRGDGAARSGDSRWRRLCERRAGGAKSVFHFDVPGSVAKSSHAGIPWLRHLRMQLGQRVHFWPFDGWQVPAGRSAIAEVYPALWKSAYPDRGLTPDQHDAFAVAAWLRDADADGRLGRAFSPALTDRERAEAELEGWILGVG